MAFKVENKNEYTVLKCTLSFYKTFLFILNKKEEEMPLQRKIIITQNLLAIKIKKAKELMELKSTVKNSILVSLQVSLNAAEDIQKCLNEQNINMDMAIERAQHFCEGYQEVYEDWNKVYDEYNATLGVKPKKVILTKYILKKLPGISDKIVKVFSKSKIDTMNEFVNISICAQSFILFQDHTKEENGDKFSNAIEIIEEADNIFILLNNSLVPCAKDGITVEWVQEGISLVRQVRENMEKFISCGEEAIYSKTIKDMHIFCKTHELDFEKWLRDFDKYVKAMKKIDVTLSIALGVLIGLLISLLSLLYYSKGFVQFTEEEGIESLEENETEEDTSLEETITKLILERKL